jgi:uncharacterized protein (TIRG00374 family)
VKTTAPRDVPNPTAPEEEVEHEEHPPRLDLSARNLVGFAFFVALAIVALYFLLPQVAGLGETWQRLHDGSPFWLGLALLFTIGMFVGYVLLFHGVFARAAAGRLTLRESYQICMAGLAATRLFSAGGAGGIALTYWALRRAGMPRRETARRMVAFLVLLYTAYLLALVVCGIFLRVGIFPGPSPVGMTIVPAGIAGAALIVLFLVSLIPNDFERLVAAWARGHRRVGLARRVASVPATVASGTRTALTLMRHPSGGSLAVLGAVGFWAANIAVLWACFHSFGESVPKAVLIQGFFVGMAANLLPFFPGGVGSVDAGMIAAFLAFGLPSSTVFVAVLAYRVIAFWLPIPPGIFAYFQLRKTVARWKQEEAPVPAG